MVGIDIADVDRRAVHHQGGRQAAVVAARPVGLAEPDRLDPPPRTSSLIQLNRYVRSARLAARVAVLQGIQGEPLHQAIP